jgi:hypothetical protein
MPVLISGGTRSGSCASMGMGTLAPRRLTRRAGASATGSVKDPESGRRVGDIHQLIDDIDWLDDTERDQIFAGSAQQLFKF